MKTPYILIRRSTIVFRTYIALDGYIRSIIKEDKLRETDRLIQDTINKYAHNLTNQISINNNQGIDISAKVLNKSVNNLVNEINKLVDKINKRSGSNNNYLDNIYQFIDFFDSYTTTELGAIGHIFACILGCLFDIAIAY
jgi:hypothetical protein